MIPQRVAIEGFLSYREEVVFYFDGAPIWMLTGENGSGKSTVFDAMTFALYGAHRGGKSGAKELIHRGSDHLAVEFDFLLGEDRYRVRRTVARRGRPTYQATHLSGPNPPNPKRSGPQAIAGTDSEDGLNRWVKSKLGLDEKAFKMSVLLEQGKSDAFLSAGSVERHKLLSSLVDLSRYVALEEAAKKRRNEAKAIAETKQDELATLPAVTPEEMARQEEAARAAQVEVEGARQHIERLQALKVHAARWGELQRQHAATSQRVEEMQALIAEAETIQADARRLAALQKALPDLRRLWQHKQEQTQYQAEWERHQSEAAALAAVVAQEQPLVEEAQREHTRLEQERERLQRSAFEALQKLNSLSATIYKLDEMERLRRALGECDEALAHFEPELDERLSAAKREVDELFTLVGLLPHLQSYVKARAAWQQASTQLDEEVAQHAEEARRASEAQARAKEAQEALAAVREQLRAAESHQGAAERVLKVVQEQLQRFEQVGALPSCPYCGQPLSAQHLDSERTRLQATLAEHKQEAAHARQATEAVLSALRAAETKAKQCYEEATSAQQAQQERAARCERLTGERARLEDEGEQALEQLRARGGSLFALPRGATVAACFGELEPSAGEVEQVAGRVQGYQAAQEKLRALQQRVNARQEQHTRRQHIESQLQPLAARYPAEEAQATRQAHAMAEKEQREAQEQLAIVEADLAEAKARLQSHNDRVEQARKDQEEAAQKAQIAGQFAANAQRLAEAEMQALSPEWQEVARTVDEAQLNLLQDEMDRLDGAAARKQALDEAQAQIAHLEARLREIAGEMAAIPEQARQPVEVLQQEEEQTRACQAEAEARLQAARSALNAMAARKERIKELTATVRAAEKKAHHYGLLAKYLGRDYLQRFLLQQAEGTIVNLANRVLDQCSGGTLRLELRPNSGEGAQQKAFELMVENLAIQSTQGKLLPAWLLSGSQRFRVAVSLALAIGQYASNNGQRIESVIIDEGFGSLDRQGLRDMEEALRELSGMIKRIILVSHQDEFARAFPHRYAISLKDGASKAELVDTLQG